MFHKLKNVTKNMKMMRRETEDNEDPKGTSTDEK